MGEAKRRGSRPPTALEKAWRWTNRVLEIYPRPVRAYVRLTAQIAVAMVVLVGLLLLVSGLMHVGEWFLHH